ncbi:MFS transporter [Dactylosporangium aurantiacum]|uniref:MFS transporter n=1 Tax=Dactylosporangium aurantiacum TaxID=35754 RepID=A0A9Q9I9Y8_9ACTN|nr:MFS transporter [Dactylosporangium aurantiacum]MDG6108719.1 MFS transporter [Dactylosporangium aurantiacum]UWZ51081.1 MFS transporter [Dactylosporangium aurantiacum]
MHMVTDARRVVEAKLPHLLLCVLLLGIADSMIGPYLVLFGADRADLSPLRVGVFLSVIAVSGLCVTSWLGRRYDRGAGRWPALLAVLAPAAGYLALSTTTTYALLLVIGAGLLGAGLAAFSQVFALARTHLERASGSAPGRGTLALRSVFSLAWAIGPILGSAALAWRGYGGLLLLTSLTFALVTAPLLLLGPTPVTSRAADRSDPPTRPRRPVLLVAASFMLFNTAMCAGSVALPLYLTRTLGRPDQDVELLASTCALAEIPAALGLILLPARVRRQWVILLGMVLFVVYFALVPATSSMPLLIAAQVARGLAIAAVNALGITYMQDLMPEATGRATALFANAFIAASLVSGLVAGATAQALGYRAALLLCAVISAAGCLLLISARPAPPALTAT